jgi:hypothetical protein
MQTTVNLPDSLCQMSEQLAASLEAAMLVSGILQLPNVCINRGADPWSAADAPVGLFSAGEVWSD